MNIGGVELFLTPPTELKFEWVGDQSLPVRPLSVAWGHNRRMLWLDDDGRPLRLWRDDGLTAAAERLVRYGRG